MLSVQSQYQSPMAHRGNVIVANGSNELGKQQLKKKMYTQSTPYAGAGQQPASVARRNARERNRVKQVNNGFATLRQHIPASVAQALGSSTVGTQGAARPTSAAASKKLSKVETLRMAVEYIRNLQIMLEEHDAEVLRAGGDGGSSLLGSPTCSRPADIKFELKSESGDEHYQQQQQLSPQPSSRQSPAYVPTPCSEASSSPTPSFVSDSSSSPASHQQHSYGANFTTTIYSTAEHYDNYEPMSPEDKVLLDYISSSYMWSQSH